MPDMVLKGMCCLLAVLKFGISVALVVMLRNECKPGIIHGVKLQRV